MKSGYWGHHFSAALAVLRRPFRPDQQRPGQEAYFKEIVEQGAQQLLAEIAEGDPRVGRLVALFAEMQGMRQGEGAR